MLIESTSRAMERATYEKFPDGLFWGRLPGCPGVVATGATLARCQRELREALDGWLIVKLRHGDKLPVIGGIDLNRPRRLPSKRLTTHA